MRAFRIALNTIRAFFGVTPDDSFQVIVKKFVFVGSKRLTYFILDYWLAGLTGAANVFLKANDVELTIAIVAMWTLNIIISYAFVMTYEKTGVDLSLGVELRRAVDRIHSESRVAGFLALSSVLFQAVFWSGPEQIVIFFKKELPGWRRWCALLVLTAVQTLIWMYLWRTGYDVVSGG
jgi:hypothetical protein